MDGQAERRREKRIRFYWPLWFGYEQEGQFVQAQVVDLCRHGVSFTVDAQACPELGSWVFTRFSYPLPHLHSFSMGSHYDWCQVQRVDAEANGVCRVVMRLQPGLAHDLEATEESEQLAQSA